MDREIRVLDVTPQIRMGETDADPIKVSGYAAVFDEEIDFRWFSEVIRPGAFSSALERGDDVVFLINHADLPLARTTSGTLTLTQDDRGLKMETELDPADPDVQRIVPKMKRGDLTKMSFAFIPTKVTWSERGDDDNELREIFDLELYDVAIVTTPAYSGTEIGLDARSVFEARKGRISAKAVRARIDLDIALAERLNL